MASNLASNPSRYLVVELGGGTVLSLAALLVRVNAGRLITPWASLAALL